MWITATLAGSPRPPGQSGFGVAWSLREQGNPTRVDLESFKGRIDFGIISIREDEFRAVLDRFAPDRYAMGSQRYAICTLLLYLQGPSPVLAILPTGA